MITLQSWSSLAGKLRVAPRLLSVGWHIFEPSVRLPSSGHLRCAMLFAMFVAAMLQQPRVPPTGQRQAVEIQIKWREVLAQKQAYLKILSQTTGHSTEKLDKVCNLRVVSQNADYHAQQWCMVCGQQTSETVAANNFWCAQTVA